MENIRVAQNNLLIQVSSAYTRASSDILRLSSLEHNSSVDLVDYAQLVGTVHSIPEKITIEGYSVKDIEIGDTIFFRYDVIHEFKQIGDEIKFRNRIWYNGQEYWNCSIDKIFGIIRDEEIIMINGHVMLYDFKEPKIYLAHGFKRSREPKVSRIMHIGYPKENQKSINAYQGDNVYFSPVKTAKYNIGDKKFRIIQQQSILGKQI